MDCLPVAYMGGWHSPSGMGRMPTRGLQSLCITMRVVLPVVRCVMMQTGEKLAFRLLNTPPMHGSAHSECFPVMLPSAAVRNAIGS